MGAYILRRLLLVIPTLFGIMLVNFTLTQFVPGGPIEQIIARVQGEADSMRNISGGGDAGAQGAGGMDEGGYQGARGISPELLAQLEVQMGFSRIVCDDGFTGTPSLRDPACHREPIPAWKRFFSMIGDYLTFDFGKSFFHNKTVMELVAEKLPVSVSLGLWSTLLAYLISIPLGIRKAVRDGSPFDTWTSGAIVVAYAIPGFLFAVMLMVLFAGGSYWKIFPLRGLTSDNFDQLSLMGKALDYLWHITLPTVAMTISGFATMTLLTKNSFLDEINKQYVITARAKGLSERRVLYGHVFRNAMLIVIAGFPATFLGVFFGSSIIVETIFSLDGLGLLGFQAAVERNYPVIFGTLYVFGLISLVVGILSDMTYVLVDPRIDFEKRSG
ncbi:microcin C ABC transporter permease YejB [Paenirhodobacter populi]|uniref:ABC transporter permease subunit n=1 Tax=Paenirhodobacter populi TaxID=2306993 RepID=A0A443JNP5_9RHOB|nr:ABC transporter permease subunit [Sinirhodobacter populi]RWR14383.1 ABC transporter permease subunit [Sinirhodobacter populi]RWR22157.1 ABC transporter permease subunit [Sinirhodobacter populi]RWR33768.1 ABC transporter permease subunit [Sinirhodobacter populi]